MGSDTVRVCVRTRPSAQFAHDRLFVDERSSSITVKLGVDEPANPSDPLNNRDTQLAFRFHSLLHNASQEDVYEAQAREIVQGAVDGTNGCILSYGQTGSGKTFTMVGDTRNYEHRGIAPRAVAHVFSEVSARPEMEMRVSCTYAEIYNERIYDLLADLAPGGGAAAPTDLTVAEDRNGKGTFVRGLREVDVDSEEAALSLFFSGELGRTTASNLLNANSNRSHCVFTLYIAQRPRSGVSERVLTSKLCLVDLAGSERLKKTLAAAGDAGAGDETLRKESRCINQSLTYLEQCVVALARREAHVPYRQSKLTSVLKDSLSGNARTLMFACIWGEAAQLEETVSTLRLASRMMRVKNKTSAVEVLDRTPSSSRSSAGSRSCSRSCSCTMRSRSAAASSMATSRRSRGRTSCSRCAATSRQAPRRTRATRCA